METRFSISSALTLGINVEMGFCRWHILFSKFVRVLSVKRLHIKIMIHLISQGGDCHGIFGLCFDPYFGSYFGWFLVPLRLLFWSLFWC